MQKTKELKAQRSQSSQDKQSNSNTKRSISAVKVQYAHLEHIANPGQRLYERGLQLTKEKERLNQIAKQEREEKEIVDHCTFKPKLVTNNYFKDRHRDDHSSFYAIEGQDELLSPILDARVH